MLAHCTEKFQSMSLSFQVELFAKQQEAMQLQLQSYTIKNTQNFHYFDPIHPTQIQMKGISPVSTYLLFSSANIN